MSSEKKVNMAELIEKAKGGEKDADAQNALELQLAEVLDGILKDIKVEAIETPWGVLGQ